MDAKALNKSLNKSYCMTLNFDNFECNKEIAKRVEVKLKANNPGWSIFDSDGKCSYRKASTLPFVAGDNGVVYEGEEFSYSEDFRFEAFKK